MGDRGEKGHSRAEGVAAPLTPSVFSLWHREEIPLRRGSLTPDWGNLSIISSPLFPRPESQGRGGTQAGSRGQTRLNEPHAPAAHMLSLAAAILSSGANVEPHLGVSGSEPRSRALCTKPVRLAICFSMASMRSLGNIGLLRAPWSTKYSHLHLPQILE